MADITVTAAQVRPVFPNSASTVIRQFKTTAAVTPGQPLYFVTTTGKVGPADANASGLQQFAGLCLTEKGAGETTSVLVRGEVYGYTLTGNYFAPVYVSDTVGLLADAAGTMTVNVGKIVPINDPDMTKVLYIEADWLRVWS
jgi:ribosomal protein L19